MNIYTTEAALAVATADLTLARSLLGAIRTADLTGRQAAAATTAVDDGRLGYLVNDRLGYRTYDRPAGYYVGTDRLGGTGRLAGWRPYDWLGPCDGRRPFDPSVPPPPPTDYRSPVQPPWKVVPWPVAFVAGHHAHVKSVAGRADVVNVGRTLDLFV